MSPVDLSIRPASVRSRAPRIVAILLAAVATLGALGITSRVVTAGTYVDAVTIVNDTSYGVDVRLHFDGGSSYVPLGRALPNRQTVRHEIHDAGDEWTFVFRRQGIDAAELTISESELRRNGWRVEFPAEATERLTAAGQTADPNEGSR